jgi:transcriptional regulator with GAF, ATPase, and Fis domain
MSGDCSSRCPVSLVGESEAIRALRDVIRRVAIGGAKVLITGESGVGKDIVARSIHAHSARESRPLVTVNCAAISETLLESELFGHVKGSFTGAYRDKIGRFQLAHRGTVFLDELGETSLRMQAMLLRFLESGEIYPVGSDAMSAIVDVRVIAATNRELDALVSSGQFREDLMYRVKVVHLHVPPLRARPEDFPALVEHILKRIGKHLQFTDDALKVLQSYHWPGNVRELQNVIEQISWIAATDIIDAGQLRDTIQFGSLPPSSQERPRQIAGELYDALRNGHLTFWGDIYPRFLKRDMTRDDLRALVRRGLEHGNGNYRAVLPLFGMSTKDYKRFLNFLAAHECAPDFRPFRASRERASAGSEA